MFDRVPEFVTHLRKNCREGVLVLLDLKIANLSGSFDQLLGGCTGEPGRVSLCFVLLLCLAEQAHRPLPTGWMTYPANSFDKKVLVVWLL